MRPKLRTGMLVQLRNGEIRMVINNAMVDKLTWVASKYKGLYQDEWDVIGVSEVLNEINLTPIKWTEEKLRKHLLWEEVKEEEMITIKGKKYSEDTIIEALKEYVPD